MIVRVYLGVLAENPNAALMDIYARVATLTGEGVTTVRRVLHEVVEGEAATDAQPRSGRKPVLTENEFYIVLEHVRSYLSTGRPLSVAALQHELAERDGLTVEHELLRRTLLRGRFKWGIAKKRNVMIGKDWVVAARLAHVKKRDLNRDDKGLPIKPEIYVDESYCRLFHTNNRTWYYPVWAPYRAESVGRGQLVVIVAAAVVWQEDGELKGGWIEDSFKCWPSSSGTDMAYFSEFSARRDASSASAATAGPTHVRLEGNMRAVIFEEWFNIMCKRAKYTFGDCIVYLDNASYHKRQLDPVPSQRSTKLQMVEWIERRYETGVGLRSLTNKELYPD